MSAKEIAEDIIDESNSSTDKFQTHTDEYLVTLAQAHLAKQEEGEEVWATFKEVAKIEISRLQEDIIAIHERANKAEQERDSWKTQWVECCENLDIVAKERDRMKQAIERALADSESGEGKWGPDVSICSYLQEALKGV